MGSDIQQCPQLDATMDVLVNGVNRGLNHEAISTSEHCSLNEIHSRKVMIFYYSSGLFKLQHKNTLQIETWELGELLL